MMMLSSKQYRNILIFLAAMIVVSLPGLTKAAIMIGQIERGVLAQAMRGSDTDSQSFSDTSLIADWSAVASAYASDVDCLLFDSFCTEWDAYAEASQSSSWALNDSGSRLDVSLSQNNDIQVLYSADVPGDARIHNSFRMVFSVDTVADFNFEVLGGWGDSLVWLWKQTTYDVYLFNDSGVAGDVTAELQPGVYEFQSIFSYDPVTGQGLYGYAGYMGAADYAFSISTIPLPPALWLFASALTGLVLAARRRVPRSPAL